MPFRVCDPHEIAFNIDGSYNSIMLVVFVLAWRAQPRALKEAKVARFLANALDNPNMDKVERESAIGLFLIKLAMPTSLVVFVITFFF